MDLSKIFKTLSDDNRLRIIRLLSHGPFHVNEIQYIVNGKQSNISHHLKILQDTEIITSKKEGSLIFYHLLNNNTNIFLQQITSLIMTKLKTISFYNEDIQRLDMINNKRKKHAEIFFNNIGKDLDSLQEQLFSHIYSVPDAIKILNRHFKNIVDIGCGTGKYLPLLSEYADQVIGLDSSPTMLQLAEHICKQNNLNFHLTAGDILHLPFQKNSIDCVFMNMVLHHIIEPDKALKEISKILRPNGQLLLIELLEHKEEMLREKYADLWLGFNKEKLEKWISKSHFQIIETNIKENQKKNENKSDFKIIILLLKKLEVIEETID